jgi:hypothetical protein
MEALGAYARFVISSANCYYLEIGRFIIIWKKKKHIFSELFNL